ncbi:MAG: hypothetical protein SNF33_04465 [Candidatus Algichlamydia australiensis]|nr:hypothetical protein [Chlamydiales bacterium]
MKKFGLLLFFSAAFGTLKADESELPSTKNIFVYGTTGLYVPTQILCYTRPFLGLGLRAQSKHLGIDLSANGTLFFSDVYALNGSALLLYYPRPNQRSEYYFGAGVGVSTVQPFSLTFVSPEFVFGKQYRTSKGRKRFLEVQFVPCTFLDGHPKERVNFPSVSIRYGFGF